MEREEQNRHIHHLPEDSKWSIRIQGFRICIVPYFANLLLPGYLALNAIFITSARGS